MTTPAGDSADRLATWTPFRGVIDFARVVADTWHLANDNRAALIRLEMAMADTTSQLTELTAAVRTVIVRLSPVFAELAQARAELAQLRGEDASESAATQDLKTAVDELSLAVNNLDTPSEPPA